jgi:hypothetical protein
VAAETTSVKSNHNIERWLLLAGLLILLLTLAVQIAIAKRETWAKNPTLRPLISQLCQIANCKLSIWRQPQAFVPIQHSVVADASQNGVLIVKISFKNTAQWPQPWPLLELAFTDINDHVIGLRRFKPTDYLNSAHSPDINANQSVEVEIAIQEIASKAVGFQFNFY